MPLRAYPFVSESSCALIGTILASVFSSYQQLHYHVNVFSIFLMKFVAKKLCQGKLVLMLQGNKLIINCCMHATF